MRVPIRSLATLVLAVGVATCADAPTVGRARTGATAGARGRGTIAMAPVFSQTAAAVYAQRATFAGASFDHVRIVLVRPGPPADTLRDTTIVFAPGAAPQTVEFTVDVATPNEAFTGAFDYTNNGQVVYHGATTVLAHALDQPAPPQQDVVITYVGPGASVTRLVVAPKTVTVVAPGSATFTATGFDASNAPVANNPVSWSVSDPTVATISGAGVLSTTGKRGVVTVSATSIAGPSDGASATVTLPPAAIALVSGGGQTGKAGVALPQSASVKVTATDGVGVAGVTVTFAAPTGGAVGSSSATTDPTGVATTSLTLGGAVGPQSFAAVAGTFSVSIPATATPGDPTAVVTVSGSGQQDTVKKAVGALVVKVTDKFANGVPGVTVSWARTAGTGALSGSSSVTGADGTASIGYTLGTTPGVETIAASVSGVTGGASFSVTALPAGPSAIASVGGGGQTGRAQQALGAPFVVKVTDASGNGVAGVSVSWSATNGTISPSTTTDADGQSSNTLTLGATLGNASATATIGSGPTAKSVTFTVTVQAGIVAQIAFRTGPPATAAVGAVLAPPIAVELRDAAGNLTAATNAVTIALGANPGQATLGGTLKVNAAAGVATFNDLTVSNAANGYTLVVSSAGVPNITSAAFNITGAGGDTWTGAASTDWFTAGNWSAGVPTATTNVVIPAGTENAPTANNSTSINDLTVAAGATLTVGGEATMVVAGNVVALGNVSNSGGDLRMTGAGKTVRGNFSYLSIAGTVSISGPLTVSSGFNMLAAGVNFTVNTTAVALGNILIGTGQLTIATGASVTATSIFTYSTGIFSQTGGALTVSTDATFGGGATTGLITGGTMTVGGNFAQRAGSSTVSFVATGTHRTILASAGAKTVIFESPAASGFHDIEIDGPGALALGSTVTASGALISPAGATPITGGGNQLIVSGLNVDGLTIDNGTIVSNGGTITKFDNVTFQNYPGTATPLTITHPGAATAFTFNNTQFLVTPTSGRYLSVTDAAPADGQVLTINLLSSAPPDGSAQTATSGGAVVIWQSAPSGTWAGTVSTDWFAAGNWGGSAVPTASTNVTIPAGVQNMPVLTANAVAANVTVAPNASLSLGSFTLTTGGNVDAGTGPGISGAGSLVMTGPTKTFRGAVSNLSIAGTISLSGAGVVTGNASVVSGGTLTVNQALTVAGSLSASGTSSAALATIVIAQGAVASAGSLSTSGASGIFSQTGGSLTVTGAATFGGNNVGNGITAGTLVVGGDFTQTGNVTTASFAATGTHLVVLNGAQTQNVNFANGPSSHFQNLSLSNSGIVVITTAGGALSVTGQLISPAGATAVQSAGRTIASAGLDVDGLTLDNTVITSTGGTITKFDNVTFQNYPGTATPLTITHPGAATAFTFNNTQFLVTPTSGRYLSVTDAAPADGRVLTINLVNSAPPDGSAQTATSGGAVVSWQSTGATIAWNNPSGGSWSLPSNWSLGRVPGPADSIVIALSGTYTVTLDTTFVGKSIVVGGASGAQTLSLASRLLTINNFLTTTGTGFFLANSSTLSGSGTIVNQGKLQLVSTTVNAALTNRGPLVISASDVVNGAMTTAAGSSILIQGDNSFGSAFLSVPNGFTNVGAIQMTSVNGGFAAQLSTTTGTLTNAAAGTITVLAGAAGGRSITGAVNNQGSIAVAQPLTVTLTSVVLVNSGTIDLSAGDMTVNLSGTAATVTNAGSVTVGVGHTLTINNGTFNQTSGTFTGAGALNLSGVTATFSSDITNATTGLSIVNSTINGPGTVTNATGKTLTLSSSTIAASSGWVNQGTLIVKGSSTINAAISTVAGSTLQVLGDNTVGSSTLTVANGFTNNGAIQLTSANGGFGASLIISNGVLTNASTGTITSVAGTAGPRTLNAQLDNQGLFTVAQTLTMSRASSTIVNSGTIDITTGDLTVNQSGTSPSVTNTGSVTIASGHLFTINNGAYAQTSGTVGGPGTFALSGVAASFTNNITNAATALTVTNSTLSGPGSLTNSAGQTLTLFSSTTAASMGLTNQGTLIIKGSTAINGTLTTVGGSLLRVQGDNTVGTSTLTVANGFTNNAAIELTSANGGFGANLVVTSGTLTNAAAGTISTLAGTAGPRALDIQLDNQGLFTVGQATTMSRASSAITNSGTIDLTAADLTINQSGTTPTVTNSGTVTVGGGHTFLINNGTYNQTSGTVSGAGVFTLSGVTANFTNNITNATTALNITNSTLNGPGSLTNSATQTLTLFSSTIAASMGLANQGTLIVKGSSAINGAVTTVGGSLLRVQGDNTVGTSTLTVANGFTNNAAIELTSANGGFGANLVATNGTLTNAAAGTISTLAGTAGPRALDAQLNNQGLFTVGLPTTMSRASSTITNSGSVDLSAGDLTINQSGTTPSVNTSGVVTIGSGHTLLINNGTFNQTGGGVTGSGTFSLSGVTANFTGSVTNATTALSVTNSTINGPGSVTNATGQTLTLFSSTIASSSPFTNQGTLIVKGTSAINSTVTTVSGSMIRVQGDNTVGSSTLTVASGFTNTAAIELTSANGGFGASMAVTNGTLMNAVGGSITAVTGTGGPRTLDAQLDNQGQFNVALPMTMSRASSVFTSSGTIDLGAGDLTISQSGTTPSVSVSGPVNLANGHTFTINNGTFNLNAGGSVSGVGTFSLSGVTANFAVNFSNASTTLSVTNSMLNGPGTITNAAGQSFTLLSSTIAAPLVNQGTLLVKGTSAINGAVTTQAGSILRVQGDNTVGSTTLTVANGFTNSATIDLTSVNGGFGANMNVTNGTLANANGATITASAGAGGPRSLNAQFDNQIGANLNVGLPTTINRASSTYTNGGTVTVSAGSLTITQSGTTPSFTNSGTLTVAGGQSFAIAGGGTFTEQAGATLNGGGTFTVSGGTANINAASMGPAAVVLSGLTAANFAQNFTTNGNLTIGATPVNGAITITNAAGQTLTLNGATIGSPTTIVNQGTLMALGTTNLNGSLNNTATATMRVQGDPTGTPASATFIVANGPSFTNTGALEMTSVSGGFSAAIQVSAGTFANSGTLTTFVGAGGARQINGAFNNTGTIAIAVGGTGTLSIGGASAAFTNSGTVNIKLNGTAAGAFDQLVVAGAATLGSGGPQGVLNVSLVAGFTPTTGNTFSVITYTSHTNNFATYTLPPGWATPTPGATAITLTAP